MKSYFALIAVGLDAAATRFKSTIEKTAASVAAAFVGIGLLAAPLEQAEANVPIVSEVILDGWDMQESDWFTMEIVHSGGGSPTWDRILYSWSGIWFWPTFAPWFWVDADAEDSFMPASGEDPFITEGNYYHPAGLYEYYICELNPFVAHRRDDNWGLIEIDESLWVEFWFFTGSIDPWTGYIPSSASVVDSEGNFYNVDLSIDGYVISGTSVD